MKDIVEINGELREDVFCRECRYDIETCGYTLSNCPYRKVSQQRYLKKYGRYRETSQEETTKILPKYYFTHNSTSYILIIRNIIKDYIINCTLEVFKYARVFLLRCN